MKISLSAFILTWILSLVQGQSDKGKTYQLVVDTCTNSNLKDGIFVNEFNIQTEDLSLKSKVAGEDNPSYVTVTEDGKHLYSVNEESNATISAFPLDPVSGELT